MATGIRAGKRAAAGTLSKGRSTGGDLVGVPPSSAGVERALSSRPNTANGARPGYR